LGETSPRWWAGSYLDWEGLAGRGGGIAIERIKTRKMGGRHLADRKRNKGGEGKCLLTAECRGLKEEKDISMLRGKRGGGRGELTSCYSLLEKKKRWGRGKEREIKLRLVREVGE